MFNLGKTVATPGALSALELAGQGPAQFLARHQSRDWGEVCEDDKLANDESLKDGSRLLSAYRTKLGVKIWIITEATDDQGRREATTILLPEEY
ncbi:hypothetical protein ETAA8_08800 [Anatilimnocola aggregata]|uniref:Type I restriction endonuclease subunit M n=1 Tax=Anatilimnocola aggregata TaxID=2528021 RepID=A0A517Y6E8_9BACT|nr:hypothetical protein [Anatilimnocola aggregata]QDU25808.1 hypothetical protein ETAA8_08800 [Anatilimnocola aggregata]